MVNLIQRYQNQIKLESFATVAIILSFANKSYSCFDVLLSSADPGDGLKQCITTLKLSSSKQYNEINLRTKMQKIRYE